VGEREEKEHDQHIINKDLAGNDYIWQGRLLTGIETSFKRQVYQQGSVSAMVDVYNGC